MTLLPQHTEIHTRPAGSSVKAAASFRHPHRHLCKPFFITIFTPSPSTLLSSGLFCLSGSLKGDKFTASQPPNSNKASTSSHAADVLLTKSRRMFSDSENASSAFSLSLVLLGETTNCDGKLWREEEMCFISRGEIESCVIGDNCRQ